MPVPVLKFTKATYTDLVFNSPPAAIRGYDPSVNVAQVVSAGDALYTQQIGSDSDIIMLVWDAKNPLSFQDYDNNFTWSSRTQTASTQSLANWYTNVAVGALNTFTLTWNDLTATVSILNNPLGFKPVPNDDGKFTGTLILRIQYS